MATDRAVTKMTAMFANQRLSGISILSPEFALHFELISLNVRS